MDYCRRKRLMRRGGDGGVVEEVDKERGHRLTRREKEVYMYTLASLRVRRWTMYRMKM
jgi:hypothetical protein